VASTFIPGRIAPIVMKLIMPINIPIHPIATPPGRPANDPNPARIAANTANSSSTPLTVNHKTIGVPIA
jgi:hypothetical protein